MASINLYLVCSVYVVTNTTWVSYIFMISSKSGLHISSSIMLSICFNHYNWGKLYFILFPLKVASIFFDLVCSVYVVTNTTEVHYSFMITSKSGFHIPGPSMFSMCSSHYTWGKLYFLLGASIFIDLVRSVYVVTIKTGVT